MGKDACLQLIVTILVITAQHSRCGLRKLCFPVITLFIVTLVAYDSGDDVRLSLGVDIFFMIVLNSLPQLA